MSITLSEIEEILLMESGEYLLQDISNLTLTPAKVWILVKRVLKQYNTKRPFVYRHNITISGKKYTYHDDVGYGPPDWISSVVPVTSYNVMGIYEALSGRTVGEMSTLEIPRGFAWHYENPYLWVGEEGIMDVKEVHDHQYELTSDSTGVVTDVTISTINQRDDYLFFDLLLARFLIMLGRSRRAFTLQELPIEMDASDLVSEGQELWRDTLEKLEENDKWWLALGEGTGV